MHKRTNRDYAMLCITVCSHTYFLFFFALGTRLGSSAAQDHSEPEYAFEVNCRTVDMIFFGIRFRPNLNRMYSTVYFDVFFAAIRSYESNTKSGHSPLSVQIRFNFWGITYCQSQHRIVKCPH